MMNCLPFCFNFAFNIILRRHAQAAEPLLVDEFDGKIFIKAGSPALFGQLPYILPAVWSVE